MKPVYECEFILNRRSGKNVYLTKGNQMISSNDRLQTYIKSQLVHFLRDFSYQQEKGNLTPDLPLFTAKRPCHLVITVSPPSKRRMDPPNFYPTVKALVDGLTDAGLWSDDNGHILKAMSFILGQVTKDKKYHLHFAAYDYQGGVNRELI